MTETASNAGAPPVTTWQPRRAVLEAVRWDGTAGVLAILAEWGADPAPGPSGGIIRIWGARGYCGAYPGDYLVRDADGATRYAPEAFEAKFEPATEQAGHAETRIADALQIVGNFLGQYGHSEIPMFRVAQDLANSIRKTLAPGGPGEPDVLDFIDATVAQISPEHIERHLRETLERAAEVNNGRPAVWSDACAPGGVVCAVPDPSRPDGICGNPVESGPCGEHEEPPDA